MNADTNIDHGVTCHPDDKIVADKLEDIEHRSVMLTTKRVQTP